jgi:outer membrane protein assembly factor BamB
MSTFSTLSANRIPVVSGLVLLTIAAGMAAGTALQADDILGRSGVQGGLVVQVGVVGEPLAQRLASLRAGKAFLVHGLSTDPAEVAEAREQLLADGVYGPVSVDVWDGQHLPYADHLVNLLIVEQPGHADRAELLRVLTPQGVLVTRDGDQWAQHIKPWPENLDQWTHYFHGPEGNPVAQDTAVGPPRRLQWLGTPRWSRHHDHMASKTSMVSAGGRVFYILDEGPRSSIQLPSVWRLIARDAFNGTILWKRDIEGWSTRHYPLKSGPADLLRRLVAVEDRVFVTLGIDAPTVILDAATGRTLKTLEGSQFTREIVVRDDIVFLVADQSPSPLPDFRRVSTFVWENTRRANPEFGWQGNPRKVLAFSADTGRLLWQTEVPVAPCSLVVDARRLVVHDGSRLVCFDRRSGDRLWESEPTPTSLPVHTNTGPRVVLYGDVVLLAANDGRISGWSADDGRKLWQQRQRPSGHQSLKDLLVVDGLVWSGEIAGGDSSGVFTGYDPLTGEVKREFPPDIEVNWFHHRCYPVKATSQFILAGRNGTEFIDLSQETWKPHHWVRGGCIYGVMPCNGLMYAGMDSCGCQLEAKLDGFKALAPGPVPQASPGQLAPESRLQRGPAYGRPAGSPAGTQDWPTYRRDAARSGAGLTAVPAELGKAWETKVGGRLSPPTIAAGRVFVSAIDAHTVHALDADDGRLRWSFTTGGRVDSPPTYYQGLLLFGSTDGYVYAVDATDGQLAWRFRGAPLDRRLMVWEQLESAWPVHGSVLVHDGVVYCTAGRSLFLDGGIRFLKLDPMTGRLLGEAAWDDRCPDTGEDFHLAFVRKMPGNNMPVASSDILTCDGRHLWMRSQKIDFDGNRLEIALQDVNLQPADDAHLFCQVGFLDDSYFFRSYWTYGRRVGGGYGAWLLAGRLVPSGRILCFDDSHVYGFGRKPQYMTNASVLGYQIFAADKAVTQQAIERLRRAEAEINARSNHRNANASDWLLRSFFPREMLSATNDAWWFDQPSMTARAMTLAEGTVFLAGYPNLIDEREAYRMPDAPSVVERLRQQAEAIEGRYGGVLWAMSKDDGQLRTRYRLDGVPVFDGMAAADASLFVSTIDGRVLRLCGMVAERLPELTGQPDRIAWDQPEDPSYLLPVDVPRGGDFDLVTRCQVVESELGYRLVGTGRGKEAIAVKRLDEPIRGVVTVTARLLLPTDSRGALQNGFLAFGDGATEDKLVKCGVRFRNPRALVIQGPLGSGKTDAAPLDFALGTALELTVTVDLGKQQVTFVAGDATVTAALVRPLESITHIGYVMDNALVDFTEFEVREAPSFNAQP